MKKSAYFLFLTLLYLPFAPQEAQAQGSAPELYNVGEVIINYVKFEDTKASDYCRLEREQIAAVFKKGFLESGVPATAVVDARPPMVGVARIQLLTEISTHVDENMNCVSWISLSAENRATVVIPPVNAPRNVTVVYWRHHMKAVSGQSLHPKKVEDALLKVIDQFSRQYRLDQPPSLQK